MCCRSGNHEELQRANGEADEDSESCDVDKKRKISRVFRYAYMLPGDNNVTAPMFVIAYQELYNRALTEVTAIRVWKFIFDNKHSESELWRKLMDENRETFFSAGTAHNQNATRRKNMVAEQKQNRVVTGGIAGRNNLEYFAGTQYSRIINETVLLETLKSYGGKSMYDDGLPVFEYSELPRGVTTSRMGPSSNGLGGTHPLSPEYMFNARREQAFKAGLIGFESNIPIDVHEDFLDPRCHFNGHTGGFMLTGECANTRGMFFCIDPSVTNIFDVSLPRSIYGAVCAGKHILALFRDENPDMQGVRGGSNASLSDCFNQMMTAKDAEHVAMEKQMAETVLAYDSIDMCDAERKGLAHYGDVEAQTNAYIIEPRQILKEIQLQTRRVQAQLIEPWKQKRNKLATVKNHDLRTSNGLDSDMMECDHLDERLEDLHNIENATRQRHCEVVKDLITLHICRIEAAFQSKVDRETVPAGYCAMYDGLKAETSRTVNNTASMAFAFDKYLNADDVSIFAHVHDWLGNFFEHDCFSTTLPASNPAPSHHRETNPFWCACAVEGRDRRIMVSTAQHTRTHTQAHASSAPKTRLSPQDEVFLHLFEQYGDVTFLVLLCGYKVRITTNPTRTPMSRFHVATQIAMHSGAVTTFASVLFRAMASRCAPSAPWPSSPRTGWSPAVPPRYALHIEPLHIITTAHEGTVQFQCWRRCPVVYRLCASASMHHICMHEHFTLSDADLPLRTGQVGHERYAATHSNTRTRTHTTPVHTYKLQCGLPMEFAQASPTRPTARMWCAAQLSLCAPLPYIPLWWTNSCLVCMCRSTTRWWMNCATPTAPTASVSTTTHLRMMLCCCQPYSCVPSLCAEYWKQIVSVAQIEQPMHTVDAVATALSYAFLA